MSKETNKLIPELRFPQFLKDGEWEEKALGDCLSKKPEYGINAPGVPYSDKLPTYLRITDISEDGHFLSSGKVSVNSAISEDNYLADGDIVLARTGASVGKGYKYRSNDGKLVFAGFLIRVRPNKNKLNSELLFQFLSTFQYWRWVSFISARSGQPGINGKEYSSMPINIPPTIKEQQKIADCLSFLDDLISAQSQKLDALKVHKKGLMQNLFPQEGETEPKYRFHEFRDKGAWVLQKLEGLAKRGSGHTPNKQMSNYYNGGIKWVSLADSNKLDNGYIYATKIQISKDGIENSSAVLHPAGAVILSRDAGVGKSALLYSEMAVSQHFIAWVCDESKLSNWFLYYVLQILKPAFESIAVGSTIKTIGLPYFKELCIPVPSIKEQQKIASCLSSLDALITAQSEKIEQLKLHKKGLMQGLFPSITN